jgi:hypothetical protein
LPFLYNRVAGCVVSPRETRPPGRPTPATGGHYQGTDADALCRAAALGRGNTMKTRLKKAAGLTAAAAALLVAGSAGSASAAATGPRAVQRCHTSGLTASLHADGNQAGVGNFGENLALTNTSKQTCTVYGYPGLGLQNAKHSVLSIKVNWGSTYFARDPKPHTITLKPGQSAWADLAWNAPYGVKSVTPSYLEVTPPNETTFRTIPFAPGAINDGSLNVTALAATPPAG